MKLAPKLVIFDVDGVLVDVHGSFHKSIIDTIYFFTKRRVTYAEIHEWKNRSGYNDDWRLTTDWIASLGEAVPYEVVKARFQKFYWGTRAIPGNVSHERLLITHARLARWAERAELALFTGRTRRELGHTLEGTHAQRIFRRAVTMDDVKKGKPDPEGLRLLLNGTPPRDALYWGIILTTRWRRNAPECRSWEFCRTAVKRIACARQSCGNWARSKFCMASAIWRNSGHEKSKSASHDHGNRYPRPPEPRRPGPR